MKRIILVAIDTDMLITKTSEESICDAVRDAVSNALDDIDSLQIEVAIGEPMTVEELQQELRANSKERTEQ